MGLMSSREPLLVKIAGGLIALALDAPLAALYAIIALGILIWGTGTIWAVRASDWSRTG